MSTANKAVLYHFTGSVWSAVPVLTALEKSLGQELLEQREVNLDAGQNFSPAFLKISPKGTVPVLVAPFEHTLSSPTGSSSDSVRYKALLSTIEICQFLDSSTLSSTSSHSAPALSPATVQGSSDSKDIIDHLHAVGSSAEGEGAPDPNALLMSFTNDEERKTKLAGDVGGYLKGRQSALEKYKKEEEALGDEKDGRVLAFYERKIRENGGLLAIYEGKSPAAEFIQHSKQSWINLGKTTTFFEDKLTANKSTYLVGDQISLADLHAGAYFARILISAISTSSVHPDSIPLSDPKHIAVAIAALNGLLPEGVVVGPKLTEWLDTVFARESFRKMYVAGLH